MTRKLSRVVLACTLSLSPLSMVACDKEDRADVREGVKDVEKEIDKADTDGKDD